MAKVGQRFAVIGAGPAGIYAAQVLAKEGFQVAIYDSHSKPGGCASFFRRDVLGSKACFDTGATVLNEFSPGRFMHRLNSYLGVNVGDFQKSKAVYFRVPGLAPFTLNLASQSTFVQSLLKAFPDDANTLSNFLPEILAKAAKIYRALQKVPHLPINSIQDIRLNASLIPILLPELGSLLVDSSISFFDLMQAQGLGPEFVKWVDMNFLITLQTTSREVHPWWGAMALYFYLMDVGTFNGGMRTLFEALLTNLKTKANVNMRHAIKRVHDEKSGYYLENFLGIKNGPFDGVISAIPRYNTQELFSHKLFNSRSDWEDLRPKMWGALAAYVVVKDFEGLPTEAFNLHSAIGQQDAYLSFSARGDLSRAPVDLRCLEICAHTSLDDWASLGQNYASEKKSRGEELLRHLNEACPGVEVVFKEFGTPRSFLRYTRRTEGAVGGVPLTKNYTLQNSLSQRTHLSNVYQIGDTSFPGQSIYSCAIGACAVVEKILGRKLKF